MTVSHRRGESHLKLDGVTDLERTIRTMEHCNICADPRHGHSFQAVNFVWSSSCTICGERISSAVVWTNDSTRHVVRCLACGVHAHRGCLHKFHTMDTSNIASSLLCTINNTRMKPTRLLGDSFGGGKEGKLDGSEPQLLDQSWCMSSMGPIRKELITKAPRRNDMQTVVSTITLPSVVSSPPSATLSTSKSQDSSMNDDDDDEVAHVTPLHQANHPFASVSRALQENILAHFQRPKRNTSDPELSGNGSTTSASSPLKVDSRELLMLPPEEERRDNSSQQRHPLLKLASGTLEVVRTTVKMPGRLGIATVAGGIAGGVAGLAMAGPAGAYAGYRMGQCAGVMGVVLEGSVSIGVVVASVTAAGYTAQQIQDQIVMERQRRVLTMGEHGTSRKVLLVRPSIEIDSCWDRFCIDAKKSAPSGLLFFDKNARRYSRDHDIIGPSESEIPTTDKVLLLVSRVLNDKTSVPGHVYRCLVNTFEERAQENIPEEDSRRHRRRRDDAHAIIKHVTATLLELRPGFGGSSAVTELTATAVEGLVFAQLYSLIFEEIANEMMERDMTLYGKIEDFERLSRQRNIDTGVGLSLEKNISWDAVRALGQLRSSQSSVEKLNVCAQFLGEISTFFSRQESRGHLCADSLLKMVCQHIMVAKLDCLNAEVAFLEEFARDEQLLRGKEGYSLVTLQAALHFLNMCDDIENDIFGQDDDEENVPLAGESSSEKVQNSLAESGELL